jgi:hypothetical protein
MRSTSIVALTLIAAVGVAPAPSAVTHRNGFYETVAVAQFAVADGLDVPADYLAALMQELVGELQQTKKFRNVRLGEESSSPEQRLLRIVGTITEFDKGNRATRYFVGFGAGRSKIRAHVKFTDAGTGAVVFEDDVDGNVVMGHFGGDSKGATRGLAKEVAKIAKRRFGN